MNARELPHHVILGIDPGTSIMGYSILQVSDPKPDVLAIGVIDLRKTKDSYAKLGHVFERVSGIIEAYHPDCMAIEAPFFGKNVQSMLKLGRAQGVAIAAAIHKNLTITEYAPTKIKMAITGQRQQRVRRLGDLRLRQVKGDAENQWCGGHLWLHHQIVFDHH